MNEQYPNGKLCEQDEGATEFKIFRYKDRVVIEFNRPMHWIALDKETAIKFSNFIKLYAEEPTNAENH